MLSVAELAALAMLIECPTCHEPPGNPCCGDQAVHFSRCAAVLVAPGSSRSNGDA